MYNYEFCHSQVLMFPLYIRINSKMNSVDTQCREKRDEVSMGEILDRLAIILSGVVIRKKVLTR